MCGSIGRICTHRGPGEAFDSSLAVYDFLLLTSLSGNFSVFIDVWSKVTQLHYVIAGFQHELLNLEEKVAKNYGKTQL